MCVGGVTILILCCNWCNTADTVCVSGITILILCVTGVTNTVCVTGVTNTDTVYVIGVTILILCNWYNTVGITGVILCV